MALTPRQRRRVKLTARMIDAARAWFTLLVFIAFPLAVFGSVAYAAAQVVDAALTPLSPSPEGMNDDR